MMMDAIDATDSPTCDASRLPGAPDAAPALPLINEIILNFIPSVSCL